MLSSGVNTKTVLENIYSNWSGEMYQLKDKNSYKVLWELTETNAKGQVLKAKLGASSIENTYDANNFLSNVSHTTIVNGTINTALQVAYSLMPLKTSSIAELLVEILISLRLLLMMITTVWLIGQILKQDSYLTMYMMPKVEL